MSIDRTTDLGERKVFEGPEADAAMVRLAVSARAFGARDSVGQRRARGALDRDLEFRIDFLDAPRRISCTATDGPLARLSPRVTSDVLRP